MNHIEKFAKVIPFFRIAATAWDEAAKATVVINGETFTGEFTPANLGRLFSVTGPGYTQQFKVLTSRKDHNVDLDIVLPGAGVLLVREKYDPVISKGSVGLFHLSPEIADENVAVKLWEMTSHELGHQLTLTYADGIVQQCKISTMGTSFTATDAEETIHVNGSEDNKGLSFQFPQLGEQITFSK